MMLYYFTFALLLIYCYFAGTEFGFGIWQLVAARNREVRALVLEQLSPLYELTNTFFAVFAITLVAVYPKAPLIYGTVLLVPVSLGVLFVGLRSFCLLYLHYRNADSKVASWLLALSAIAAPFFLATFYAVSIKNTIVIDGTHVIYSLRDVLFNPLTIWIAAILISHNVYFATLKLAAKTKKEIFSTSAGMFAAVAELIVLFAVYTNSGVQFVQNITNNSLLILFVLYLLTFPLVMFFLRKHKFSYLWLMHVVQLAMLYALYIAGNYPYILNPFITVYDTTNPATYHALLYGTAGGLVILVPALLYLAKFLKQK